MRDPLKGGGGGREIYRENTVVLRKGTVIKSKRNIFKNYSLWTLPRKNLCASHLSIHYFSLLSYHLWPINGVATSLKSSFSIHSLQIYCIWLFGP